MPVIDLELFIDAPIDLVFDLSRSIEAHLHSTRHTGERVVDGLTSGLLEAGNEVTWEARHLGVRQRLTVHMVFCQRPERFRDSMVRGAFRRFDHDHVFESSDGGTIVRERFDFEAPLGWLGRAAEALFLTRYMRRFLMRRLETIKSLAESSDWRNHIPNGDRPDSGETSRP